MNLCILTLTIRKFIVENIKKRLRGWNSYRIPKNHDFWGPGDITKYPRRFQRNRFPMTCARDQVAKKSFSVLLETGFKEPPMEVQFLNFV